jgi:pimeloyl-ACP methyl ester carboxylesterase
MTEEFTIPAADPGISLYIRNKHRADLTGVGPDKIVLFVHGAAFPAESAFDFAPNGLSWMDFIAHRGFDVYLVDVRGYGRSTRPPEMDEPADRNPPFADTQAAVHDVSAAADFILSRRGVPRIALIGWSWGTTIMASFATQNSAKVERLVLYAPGWIRQAPAPAQAAAPLGAYRTVTKETALKRWLAGVPEEKKGELIPPGWFDRWAEATFETDPVGSRANPPVLRAPNGAVQDARNYWAQGKPMYDPTQITVPVLVIRADWDQESLAEMVQGLFSLLVNVPSKRSVTIGEGTHFVLWEKNRTQLFDEVQLFLEEPSRGE